jgi:hypothetical protein
MKKRLLAILLTLCMVAALLPTAALAGDGAAAKWDGTIASAFQSGTGTSNDPYIIATGDQLAYLATLVNAGNATYNSSSVYYKLTADIDLNNKAWTPIGLDETGKKFKAKFDGDSHTISNLYANLPNQDYVGLFGELESPGVIKNVTVKNVNISALSMIGAVVGYAYTGTVENCHVTGKINLDANYYKVGGLTGGGYATIKNCSVTGAADYDNKIVATYLRADYEGDNVGGLAGFIGEGTTAISGCSVSNVTVSGTRKVGGLIGSAYCNNKISGCSVDNVTVICTATKEYAELADNQGKMGIGGMIGQFVSASNGELSSCTVSNVTIQFDTDNNSAVMAKISVGLVSGGLRHDKDANGVAYDSVEQNKLIGPTEDQMTVSNIQIKGTNSLPDGIKEFSGVGQIEAIGLPVAKVGDISYNTLEAAIAAAGSATQAEPLTITLLKDVEITSQISIPANVTLDGAGHSIIATTEGETQWSTENPSKYMLLVSTDNVTIKNLTVDGNNKTGTCGVQFYLAANGKLENVTVKDTQKLGLNINASDVTATGTLALSGNGWGDIINVSWGKDITTTRTVCSFDYSAATVSATLVYSDSGDLNRAAENNAKIEIKAPTSGWIVLNDGSKGYAPVSSAVAQIGEIQYATLGTAFNEAADGDTIELLTDITAFTGINYSGGKSITLDLNEKSVSMSGESAFLNVTAGTVTVTGNGTVSGSATSILATSGEGKIEVDSGTFSSDVTKYCAEGLVANKNTGENTWTVGKVTKVDGVTSAVKKSEETAGETVGSVAATVTNQAAALEVAKSVTVKDNNDAIGYVKVTDAEVTEALLKLKAAGAIELNNDGTLANGSEISVTYKVYMVAEATAYDATDKTAELNIEPKYDIIVSGKKGNADGSEVTVVSGRSTTVEGNVEVSVKLSSEFVGNATTAYITHEHGDATYLYKGTIANDKLTFVNPYGFSKFKVSLKAPYKNWINRTEDMEKFDSLQEAVEDVQNGETIYLADETSDTIYVGRTVTFTLDGPFEGQVVASNIYTTVNKTGSGDKITYTCVYTAPSVPVYRVVVNDAEGGKIKASANKAAEGATIVLTPIADDEEGELETLAVVDEDGNAVTLTKRANGTYSFVMPAKAVTVTGTFTIVADPEEPDEDEEPGDEEEETVFTDVDEDAYYAEAVAWAVANEITKGTSETTFSPDDDCTRAQVVTFLWRYAGKPEPTTAENPFTDVEEGTDYYKAILWAYENGITTGTSETTFSPDETCTRAQVVTFLWRYEGELTYEEAETFTDVAEDAYYAKAVAWAVHEWITNGTGDGQFSPDDTCTRGQVVTFLYRDTAEG